MLARADEAFGVVENRGKSTRGAGKRQQYRIVTDAGIKGLLDMAAGGAQLLGQADRVARINDVVVVAGRQQHGRRIPIGEIDRLGRRKVGADVLTENGPQALAGKR